MTKLVWDLVGSRKYETGVDKGVLYLPGQAGVPWNGMTSVDEKLSESSAPYFLDGVKYLDREILGDFAGSLKAITYPDQFEACQGNKSLGNGLIAHDQPPKTFGLSYQTRVADDITGVDLGYKIHVLWNVTALPTSISYQTLEGSVTDPLEFGWDLVATPAPIAGRRPTAHVIFDSTKLNPTLMAWLKTQLYGSGSTEPTLPLANDIATFFYNYLSIQIIDNGDGTWTAIGPDEQITMLEATIFQISKVDATYLDANTYTISTTPPSP